jgi:hypothetical protein
MNRKKLMELIEKHNLDIKIPNKVPKLNESFKRYMSENNKTQDDVVELEFTGGFTLMEKFQVSEDMNETTMEKCKKMKEKYKDEEGIYISVMSKGNAVTQNRTLYPYETIDQGLKEKTFKGRLKRNEVLMHANHPSWWEGVNESVLNECGVIKEFFWEEIDGNPSVCPTGCDPTQKKHKKGTRVESNGKPMIRLYAVFKLFGQHKEHLEDYIENARLGISSRGYGIGEDVYDQAENFLYYELQAIQWETWDFVTRPSVAEASFTIDGELNSSQNSDDDMDNKESKNESVSSEVGNIKNETYNVVDNGSNTEASDNNHPTEENRMNKEEFLKFLKTAEGKALFDEMVSEEIKSLQETEETESLKDEIAKLQESYENTVKELESAQSTNEKIKEDKKELEDKLAEIEKADFEAYKESFFAKYTEKYVEGLKADTKECTDLESFKNVCEMITKYFPESANVEYVAPVEEEVQPETEEVETVEPTEAPAIVENKEDSDKFDNMIEQSRKIFS